MSVAVVWLVASVALLGWCVWSGIQAWRYFDFFSGAAKSSIVVGILSLGVVFGASLALRTRPFGSFVLKVGAYVAILYSLAYFVLGGAEDAPGHIPGVVALLVLASLTLYCFRKASVRPNTSLERTREG